MSNEIALNKITLDFDNKESKARYSVEIKDAESIDEIITGKDWVCVTTDKKVGIYALVPKEELKENNNEQARIYRVMHGVHAHWKEPYLRGYLCSNCGEFNHIKSSFCPHCGSVNGDIHARWEDSSNGWMCSYCYRDFTYDTDYCPHCGAKMDEVV